MAPDQSPWQAYDVPAPDVDAVDQILAAIGETTPRVRRGMGWPVVAAIAVVVLASIGWAISQRKANVRPPAQTPAPKPLGGKAPPSPIAKAKRSEPRAKRQEKRDERVEEQVKDQRKALSQQEINRPLSRSRKAIAHCYSRALKRNPAFRKITARFVLKVAADGKVANASVRIDPRPEELPDNGFVNCLERVASRWRYRATGRSLKVVLPMKFR